MEEITITQSPEIVFIVPYRDRELQLRYFIRHMKYIMEDAEPNTYTFLIVQQNDTRPFNRGAMKNIGALQAKQKWPEAYANMTLVFNDVDTMPIEKGLFEYKTTPGTVKHFYGFRHALGGIVSICGSDFDACGGFPNLWAWGFEDNVMQIRCEKQKLRIQRDPFYPIMDKNIIHLQDGMFRQINRREFDIGTSKHADTVHDISQLQLSNADDLYVVLVNSFQTKYAPPSEHTFKLHDLRDGNRVFTKPSVKKHKMIFY